MHISLLPCLTLFYFSTFSRIFYFQLSVETSFCSNLALVSRKILQKWKKSEKSKNWVSIQPFTQSLLQKWIISCSHKKLSKSMYQFVNWVSTQPFTQSLLQKWIISCSHKKLCKSMYHFFPNILFTVVCRNKLLLKNCSSLIQTLIFWHSV